MADASPDRYTMDHLSTPIGVAAFVTDARGALRAFDWAESFDARILGHLWRGAGEHAVLLRGKATESVRSALESYFAGDLGALDALACDAPGTPFQRAVWAALRAIPAGTTESYGELAARIGAPKAFRAVGLANNRNPIGVVVPCHRVIGADGSLTGYAGGLPRKQWLLAHEARHAGQGPWMARTARASSASAAESLSMRAISAR